MKYLFWCSGASALVLGFIFLRSSQVTQPLANLFAKDSPSKDGDRSLPPTPPQNLQITEQSILERAKTSANSDRLKQAINLADTLPTTSAYYATAQQFREVWARELLQRAINKYVKADLPTALKMLAAIPANTSSAAQSMQLATLWQQERSVTRMAAQAKTTINSPKAIVLPPAIQSTIQPVVANQPTRRIVLAPPSTAVLQEDQRVLEMLSTIPAHWNQYQRVKPVVEKAIANIDSATASSVVPTPTRPESSPSPYFSPSLNPVPSASLGSETLRSSLANTVPTPSTHRPYPIYK